MLSANWMKYLFTRARLLRNISTGVKCCDMHRYLEYITAEIDDREQSWPIAPPPPPPPPRTNKPQFCIWVKSLWTSDAMSRRISSASGKNLLLEGAKPLPATTLTYHQRGTLTFTPGQCLYKYLRHQPPSYVGKFHIWNHSHISQMPTKCCTRMSEWPISFIKSTLELPCDLPCVN